jgi:glutamine synthetase
MTPKEVLTLIREKQVKCVDLRFVDFPGTWQHVTTPATNIEESTFEEGVGFDGSSIRGWQAINESDMLMMPDPGTAFIDPFFKDTTLVMTCSIKDPLTHQDYSRDPRFIARKSINYMQSSGVADTAYFGPELEFFVFDSLEVDQGANFSYHRVDSSEGIWNSGKAGTPENPNLGYKIRHKEGYYPVPPTDTLQDLRAEIMLKLIDAGIPIELNHHEVASGGQGEIGMKFSPLIQMADKVMIYKYMVKNVAKKWGKCATFMPKPLFNDNGTGMHVHTSLWKGGANLFAGSGYAGFSETGLYAIGGLLKHAPSICAFSNPTTNSYKRLVPGFEAPVNLAYSQRNRSASIRIPMYSANPKAKRLEFRCPDPSSNPYLTFSVMLMAMLDGIKNKIKPGEPLDKDIYDLEPEELSKVPKAPGSLDEALGNLERDHDFLLQGDVFTKDVIKGWLAYKRTKEVDPMRLRPHPYEFFLYFDC